MPFAPSGPADSQAPTPRAIALDGLPDAIQAQLPIFEASVHDPRSSLRAYRGSAAELERAVGSRVVLSGSGPEDAFLITATGTLRYDAARGPRRTRYADFAPWLIDAASNEVMGFGMRDGIPGPLGTRRDK